MITLDWQGTRKDVAHLMAAYAKLPRHIAKKHLQASMKRAMKGGVPVLKGVTPKGKRRMVVAKEGAKPKNIAGALRRAVIAKSRYIGRNKDGVVFGTIGYKAGFESRKSLWLEFGTNRGIKPHGILQRFLAAYSGPVVGKLEKEMADALEMAARELDSPYNKGYQK